MKANQCGTWTEQVMYKQGYLTSNQKQAAGIYGNGCEGCASISYATASPKPRCKLGNFMVTSNATCDKFNQKEKQHD